jgi:hypothetical protein
VPAANARKQKDKRWLTYQICAERGSSLFHRTSQGPWSGTQSNLWQYRWQLVESMFKKQTPDLYLYSGWGATKHTVPRLYVDPRGPFSPDAGNWLPLSTEETVRSFLGSSTSPWEKTWSYWQITSMKREHFRNKKRFLEVKGINRKE